MCEACRDRLCRRTAEGFEAEEIDKIHEKDEALRPDEKRR
jgi:hypothetical protein